MSIWFWVLTWICASPVFGLVIAQFIGAGSGKIRQLDEQVATPAAVKARRFARWSASFRPNEMQIAGATIARRRGDLHIARSDRARSSKMPMPV